MKSVEITASGEFGSYTTEQVSEVLFLARQAAWDRFDRARLMDDQPGMLHFSDMITQIEDAINWVTPED